MQEYAKDFHAKNIANQSKWQLSLFKMEQLVTVYKFMQLKNLISKENTVDQGNTV